MDNTGEKEGKEEREALDAREEEFCTLYVYGGSEFAGQHVKCYADVFGHCDRISVKSRKLLARLPVQARIKELAALLQGETETIAVKLQVAETLKAVMDETSTAQFSDKSGIRLSPAPLRAVSVNAAKALMELYPVKHAHETKLRTEGANGGVVFNVIVPRIKTNGDED
jgi:hypothetical protein